MSALYSANTFASFWKPAWPFPLSISDFQDRVAGLFDVFPAPADWDTFQELALGEARFGPQHFQLKPLQRFYYGIRPMMPGWVRPLLHKVVGRRNSTHKLLHWPVDERYAAFIFDIMAYSLYRVGRTEMPFLHFWPQGKRFAFVLTHDVESARGQEFVPALAALDEKYGFHSSFNFVPGDYRVDLSLLQQLKQRGFEVGVHGFNHDGRLFSSRLYFDQQALKINRVLHQWGAAGFRSPFTHRNPQWMQSLDAEYDSSFFDTDPFEGIAGGTMSLWPFFMGRILELPFTLAQDHTLLISLGETTPRLWLEKVEFIRRYCGMALVNTHPDYLHYPPRLAVYEEFLRCMNQQPDAWSALPRDVARWWQCRAALPFPLLSSTLDDQLPGASLAILRLDEGYLSIDQPSA